MLAEIPLEEFLATLDRCAEDLLWEAGVDRPPVDAFLVASRLGMPVAKDGRLATRGRVVRWRQAGGDTAGAIALGDEERPERRHFTVAHEVAEAHAYRVYQLLGVDPREGGTSREGIANALAGRLLTPRRWLAGVWNDLDGDLEAIKEVFATASYELLARRELECVTTPLLVTVADQGRVSWRRWNLDGSPPAMTALEQDCLAFAHETGEPAWGDGRDEPRTAAGAPLERVRCWPIHEPGWRREILVTEPMAEASTWF